MVFIEPEIKQIISQIENEEHAKMLTDYISTLLDEITTLEEIREENEEEINHLETDIKDRPQC